MDLVLELRRRGQLFAGGDTWCELEVRHECASRRTAAIICDMWDQHWSAGATSRVAALAPRINDVAHQLRGAGALIIHAPSETIDFYHDHPARTRLADLPRTNPPQPLTLADPPLPIDDSDDGSDTGETKPYAVWQRQHPAIEIANDDAISDDGNEIYSLLKAEDIQTVIMVGVHTNMCVLNRSFGIKNLVRWRFNTLLVRDLTDTMYNPAMAPYVSHDQGTELVVEHIEKYWCPTTSKASILANF